MIKKIVVLSTLCTVGLVSGLEHTRTAADARILGSPQKGASMKLRNGESYHPFYSGKTTVSPKILSASEQKILDRARTNCSILSTEADTKKFESASRRLDETFAGYASQNVYSLKNSCIKPTQKLIDKVTIADITKNMTAKQPEASNAPVYTEFDSFSQVENKNKELENAEGALDDESDSSDTVIVDSEDPNTMELEPGTSETIRVNSKDEASGILGSSVPSLNTSSDNNKTPRTNSTETKSRKEQRVSKPTRGETIREATKIWMSEQQRFNAARALLTQPLAMSTRKALTMIETKPDTTKMPSPANTIAWRRIQIKAMAIERLKKAGTKKEENTKPPFLSHKPLI